MSNFDLPPQEPSRPETPQPTAESVRQKRLELQASLIAVVNLESQPDLPLEKVEMELAKYREALTLLGQERDLVEQEGGDEEAVDELKYAAMDLEHQLWTLEWHLVEKAQALVERYLALAEKYLEDGDPQVVVDRGMGREEFRKDLEVSADLTRKASEALQRAKDYLENH